MLARIAVLGFVACLATGANAGGLATQDLNAGLVPADLVNTLLGGGVAVNNVQYTGSNVAAGRFTGGTGIIGFESGIILSSGNVANVVGPNASPSIGASNGTGGDGDLAAIVGQATYDASILEFDFVPTTSVITFSYVFASDEYNEYVGSDYNDVFAFFVNGVNQALIPGTTTAVSINNVNNGTNSSYYINNDNQTGGAPLNTEMDGVTVVLTLTTQVNPGVTNHIKLAIADAGDNVYDSVVFLAAGSFISSNITLTPLSATNPVGTQHMVTASVTEDGEPVPGIEVHFNVIAGPHAGALGSAFTQLDGVATWFYLGTTAGTDTIQATATISDALQTSNNAYKTWEGGTALSARALKQEALRHLEGGETDGIDGPTKVAGGKGAAAIPGALAQAIKQIQASLNPAYWADDNHLTLIGLPVFHKEIEAVHNLEKIVGNPSADPLLRAAAQAAIDDLVAADDLLALTVIGEALAKTKTKGGKSPLEKAGNYYSAGQAECAADRWRRAIAYFSHAWVQAQIALGNKPK